MNLENSYASLSKKLYTLLHPVPVKKPKLIVFNESLAHSLSLDLSDYSSQELAQIFAGNKIFPGTTPLAQAYAGHQFTHFTTLGDGRAILLGEQVLPNGDRFDIQLKGSGVTPYSRGGDGRATLKSMLREYLMSESLHHLGVSSSRSLAVTCTGEAVYREKKEHGAVLARIMKSHIRIGTFQYVANFLPRQDLQKFTQYCIDRLYPQISSSDNPPLALLEAVMHEQIKLIINWMRIGFIHGVMNTDNTSISGESFDYGPCSFMNYYNPYATFSVIDAYKRYAFHHQPHILLWNLYRFAETLIPLISEDEAKAIDLTYSVLNPYENIFNESYLQMMRNKLGILDKKESDLKLVQDLLQCMYKSQSDYTNTFIELMYPGTLGEPNFYDEDFLSWQTEWKKRVSGANILPPQSLEIMKNNNPILIPRSHRIEQALDQAQEGGNLELFHSLNEDLQNPYDFNGYSQAMDPPSKNFDKNYKTHCNT